MRLGNPCCMAGMGSWVDDLEQLMNTAGQVYQQVTTRPNIRQLPGSTPTWGSGQTIWGETTPAPYYTPQSQQTNFMPLLIVGGLAFLLLRR